MLFALHRPLLIDGPAKHVHDATQGGLTHGDADGRSGVRDLGTAAQPVGGAHGDGAHDAVTKLLLDFEGQIDRLDLQGVIDLGHLTPRELDVHHGADDLHDVTGAHNCFLFRPCGC
jgi:hypothetical protein